MTLVADDRAPRLQQHKRQALTLAEDCAKRLGRAERQLIAATQLAADRGASDDEIADATRLSVETVRRLRDSSVC
jgi:hypothetical protein